MYKYYIYIQDIYYKPLKKGSKALSVYLYSSVEIGIFFTNTFSTAVSILKSL